MIKYIANTMPKPEKVPSVTMKEAELARSFHKSFPEYKKTPLISLKEIASKFNIKGIYVKDESKRYGLNAFKVLGASYAMGKYIAKKAEIFQEELTLDTIIAKTKTLGEIPFFAATDGNHGRAVAWTAKKLNQPANIYMPIGSSQERLENIKAEGAFAEITNLNYDDAVRLASKKADDANGIIIQDTAWEGYEDIPQNIMEGYGVIVSEIFDDLKVLPSHVFLQAGVGSFAGGVTGCIYDYCKKNNFKMPMVIVVESDQADCYYISAKSGDGKARFVGGDMQTLMAGLACGEPNTVAFDLLKNHASYFFSCSDKITSDGMRFLASQGIISGESGAVTAGLLANICMFEDKIKSDLELDEKSEVLLISTEGDTDKERYTDIVWFGKNNL